MLETLLNADSANNCCFVFKDARHYLINRLSVKDTYDTQFKNNRSPIRKA